MKEPMINEKLDVVDALPKLYLPYAGYVIQTRALPDARDGLKTGARFILYAQYLEKLTCDKKKRKAVATIGATMNFSVHGDTSIYGNAIRMSQKFSLRYPVIDVQGNNGYMLFGDDYAAARYVEMSGGKIAYEMTELLPKETIDDWKLNYTQEKYYPAVLPTKFPFSLVNGNTGIGVGCSSSIPQFNIGEVSNSLIKLLNNSETPFEELYCPIDFATGGIIINESQVKESLKTGGGKAAVIRAKIEYDIENHELVVTEMPYQCFTANTVAQIQKAIDNNKLLGVDAVFDGTGREGVKICVKLTKTAIPENVVKQLYKETSLQSYFSINMMMLKDGKIPMRFGWKEAMSAYLDHLQDVIRKSYIYDLKILKNKLEILEGYSKALENIEEVVKIIKNSKTADIAKTQLISAYGFSEVQIKAILDLKLIRLVNMEKIKIENDILDSKTKINKINNILDVEENFKKEIQKEILSIKTKYEDARRTINIDLVMGEKEESEPVEKKALIIHLTNFGNLYTSETTTLIAQKRGGKGTKTKLTKGEYIIETITDTNYGTAIIFSNLGKIYTFNLNDLPVEEKVNLNSMLNLESNEFITNILSYNKADDYKYIVFTTKQGMVKKTLLSEYKVKKSTGVVGLKLKEDDSLVNISFINEEPLGLLTKKGYFLIIETSLINPIGRIAMGVKGIKLGDDDFVIDAKTIKSLEDDVVSISQKGLLKRTSISEFGISNRTTKGSILQKQKENDCIINFETISKLDKEIIVVSNSSTIKVSTNEILSTGKGGIGVSGMKLSDNELIVSIIKSL